jgi:antitoxin MazE
MDWRIKMQTTIVKWGNSQGIRIPTACLKNIHVSENDPVDIILSGGKIIIKKMNNRGASPAVSTKFSVI